MSKVDFKFELGDILKDVVTGLEGVVMVRAEYSTGCHHYGVLSRELKDGSTKEWEWFDQSRLQRIEEQSVKFDLPKNGTTSGAFPSGPGK